MANYLKFSCIYCGQHIECETGLSGRQIKCPTCRSRIVVPAAVRGQPAGKHPLTKFTWDTSVPLPEVKDAKEGGG